MVADEMDTDTHADCEPSKPPLGRSTSQPSFLSADTESFESKTKHLLDEPVDSVTTSAQRVEVESVFEGTEEMEMDESSRGEKEGLEWRRLVYSREEMEAMRFANMAEQRKVWKIVCEGLDDATKKEYDDLASSKRNRHRLVKKERSPETLRDSCSEVNGKGLANLVKSEMGDTDTSCAYRFGDEEDCPAGDYIEEDDSDEEYSIQRPAFMVEGEPNFDSGPPEDGLEYLRRVRWEAAKIPKVTVAKLDKIKLSKEQSDYMPKIPEIEICQEHLLPSKQWEDAFLAEFSQLRMVMSHLQITGVKSPVGQQSPLILPVDNYPSQLSGSFILSDSEQMTTATDSHNYADCLGSENENDQLSSLSTEEDNNISVSPDKSAPKSSLKEDGNNYPLLSLMLRMDSVSRVSKLKKKISSFCAMDSLEKNDCLWLFAFCAVIDAPLDADTCASLRNLLRKSASLRAQKSVIDDEVVMLNILATIAGRYFGQLKS